MDVYGCVEGCLFCIHCGLPCHILIIAVTTMTMVSYKKTQSSNNFITTNFSDLFLSCFTFTKCNSLIKY